MRAGPRVGKDADTMAAVISIMVQPASGASVYVVSSLTSCKNTEIRYDAAKTTLRGRTRGVSTTSPACRSRTPCRKEREAWPRGGRRGRGRDRQETQCKDHAQAKLLCDSEVLQLPDLGNRKTQDHDVRDDGGPGVEQADDGSLYAVARCGWIPDLAGRRAVEIREEGRNDSPCHHKSTNRVACLLEVTEAEHTVVEAEKAQLAPDEAPDCLVFAKRQSCPLTRRKGRG